MNELKEYNPLLNTEIDKDRYFNMLAENGYQISEDNAEFGEHRLKVSIPKGWHQIEVEFPYISKTDRRYYYGNLPEHLQERSLILDTDHPEYQKLLNSFLRKVSDHENLLKNAQILKNFMSENFRTTSSDEDVHRMSEIIEKRKSACAGLTLISGLLYKDIPSASSITVQEISGSSMQFEKQRDSSIGHMWLRLTDGKSVVLYDPFYNKFEVYDLSVISADENDPFNKYEIQALGAGVIIKDAQADQAQGIKLVANRYGNKEAWYNQRNAHIAQILGHEEYQFHTDGGMLELVNGAIENSRNRQSKTSGRYLTPVNKLFPIEL